MTLRLRITLAVAVLVAVAIALAASVSYALAARQLHDEIDGFLIAQASAVGPLRLGQGAAAADDRAVGRFLGGLRGSDTILQGIRPNGQPVPVVRDDVVLPVNNADRRIAAGASDRQLRTETVDGVEIRMITSSLTNSVGNPLGALQIGRELTETSSVLTGLRRWLIVVGLAGTGLATLAAWVLGSRLSGPIRRLSDAAEEMATTQQFSSRLDVSGSDEVARLGTSLNTMLGALETSRQQQRRLVMDASHELRTPLTSVRTNVDLLRRIEHLPQPDRDAILADLDREVTELTDLASELVELATSSQRTEEPRQLVDMEELVNDAAAGARRRTGRAIDIRVIAPGEVLGQRGVLERAVSNLVDNACKFSPPESVVEISVNRNEVAVRDHGPGIPAEDRPRVFDRFYRATATRDAPGSGLGLAIVAEAVAAHGGSVFAEDAPGGGAIVGFVLPSELTPS